MSRPIARDLGEQTWLDVAARSAPTLLVPVGSVEQHGPHLPLDTDTRIAVAVASGSAARLPNAIVAPAVSYGASGEHQGFPGTLSLGTEALTTVLVELGRSADHFSGVVFVNGHGGNHDALRRAASVLTEEGRRVRCWGARVPEGDAHAGRTETSLLLAIAPTLVHLESAEAGDLRPVHELLPELRAGGVGAVSPNGVLGDPAGASAAEGRHVLASLVAALTAEVAQFCDAGARELLR